MTNRRHITLAIALLVALAAGFLSGPFIWQTPSIDSRPCPVGWVAVEGPAICELAPLN